MGPTCHMGNDTWWGELNKIVLDFSELENIISNRKTSNPDNIF